MIAKGNAVVLRSTILCIVWAKWVMHLSKIMKQNEGQNTHQPWVGFEPVTENSATNPMTVRERTAVPVDSILFRNVKLGQFVRLA